MRIHAWKIVLCFALSAFLGGILASRSLAEDGTKAAAETGMAAKAEAATKSFEVEKVERITPEDYSFYNAWPTVARLEDGTLFVAWSGSRQRHVDPFGAVMGMVSRDGGKTWSWPRALYDGPIDDRDAGLLQTDKGTLLLTTFTAHSYNMPVYQKGLPPKERAKIKRFNRAMTDEQRQAAAGAWILRSEDEGATWNPPLRVPMSSPHGPIQLQDGRLLYPGVEMPGTAESRQVGVWESNDDGKSWTFLAPIPPLAGGDTKAFHELHGVEAPSGKLIVQIRSQIDPKNPETLQSVSTDGGKTWSVPESLGIEGYPSELLRLQDGRILMTYGSRIEPLGIQARVSADEGTTWSPAMILTGDGDNWDLGYPSTVQLGDGSLLTVWYENEADSPLAVLKQVTWKLLPRQDQSSPPSES